MPVKFSDIDRGQFTGAGTGAGPSLIKPSGQDQFGPIDPRAFINTKLKELGDQAEAQYKAALDSGLDQAAIQRLASGIQDEYDQAKGQLTSGLGQLNLIEQGVTSGEMTAEAGREAAIRMIVPRETADLMFPSIEEEPRGRFSPTQMGFTGYPEMIEDMQIEGLNPDGSYNPTAMKQQYFRARNASFYDQFNSAQKREWDTMWSAGLYDPEMQRQWEEQKQSDPDLFTGKAGDSSIMRAADKKASPLARSIAKGLPGPVPTSGTIRMRGPTGKEFDVPVGKVQAAMQAGGTMVVPEEAPVRKPRRNIPIPDFSAFHVGGM